jgi:hypothetical protein
MWPVLAVEQSILNQLLNILGRTLKMKWNWRLCQSSVNRGRDVDIAAGKR